MSKDEPRFDLIVTGDLVLDGRVLPSATIGVRGERICAVLDGPEGIHATRSLDCRGKYILPGIVDSHVHTLSAPSEGIRRATAAAAAGGISTIIDMPYDNPKPVVDAGRLAEKVDAVRSEAIVDVGLYGSIAKVDGLSAVGDLMAGGVLAFKFSLFETDPVRFPRIADGDLLAAFEMLAESGVPIVLHAELQEIIERLLRENTTSTEPGAHGVTHPVVSETGAVAKAMELALWTGARVHIAHVTHPHGFRLIEWYRGLGAKVSGETCAHYLALNGNDVNALGPVAKVNPPIRDRDAQEGLWAAVAAGRVASVSSDHAPWPLEAKQRPMLEAASGIPGLETLLPVLYSEAIRRGLSITKVVQLLASGPADIFGLSARKGRLSVGADADFVVFDPNVEWVFDAGLSRSAARWSPFHGKALRGRVEATYVRGRPVFEKGEVVGVPGHGCVLARPGAEGRSR